jgi:hypothetical protein
MGVPVEPVPAGREMIAKRSEGRGRRRRAPGPEEIAQAFDASSDEAIDAGLGGARQRVGALELDDRAERSDRYHS